MTVSWAEAFALQNEGEEERPPRELPKACERPLFLSRGLYAAAMREYPDGTAVVAGELVRFVETVPIPTTT